MGFSDAQTCASRFVSDNFCWQHGKEPSANASVNIQRVHVMLRGNTPEQRRRARTEPHNRRSVLVFNGGAHARDSEGAGSYQAQYARAHAFAVALKEVFRGPVVYLTVVRGHPCCQRFANPLSMRDAERVTANGWYNWKEFQEHMATHVWDSKWEERERRSMTEEDQKEDTQEPDRVPKVLCSFCRKVLKCSDSDTGSEGWECQACGKEGRGRVGWGMGNAHPWRSKSNCAMSASTPHTLPLPVNTSTPPHTHLLVGEEREQVHSTACVKNVFQNHL